MPSQADRWRRLHGFLLNPDEAFLVTIDRGERRERWLSDKYVMVSLLAAQVAELWDADEWPDGTYKVRATQPPVRIDSGYGEKVVPALTSQLAGRLDKWGGMTASLLTSTAWAMNTDPRREPSQLLTSEAPGEPMGFTLLNARVFWHWSREAVHPDRADFHRLSEMKMVRVDRVQVDRYSSSAELLGYIVPVMAGLPEFPVDLFAATQAAA